MYIESDTVSQWPNWRHFGEPLGEAESLLEEVSFKNATKVWVGPYRKSRMSDASQVRD